MIYLKPRLRNGHLVRTPSNKLAICTEETPPCIDWTNPPINRPIATISVSPPDYASGTPCGNIYHGLVLTGDSFTFSSGIYDCVWTWEQNVILGGWAIYRVTLTITNHWSPQDWSASLDSLFYYEWPSLSPGELGYGWTSGSSINSYNTLSVVDGKLSGGWTWNGTTNYPENAGVCLGGGPGGDVAVSVTVSTP